MKYLVNGKEITREEMDGVIDNIREKEIIATNLHKIGCYEYEVWDGGNTYTFIPDQN